MTEHRVLGLDLGTNSIGWSLISYDGTPDDRRPREIVACGVRVFQEAVDAKSREPKNKARRAARALRRQTQRRRWRIRDLERILVANNVLISPIPEPREATLNAIGNPYELRTRGLDSALTLQEFGRVLLHLAKRRGFKSNRKGERDEKEESVVLLAINELEEAIVASGARTLGEYLFRQPTQRQRRTRRSMYEAEFELLWRRQSLEHPNVLTGALHLAVSRKLFWQRPLRLQAHLVGKCTFHSNRPRAAKWTLAFQQSRMLQAINQLAVRDPSTRDYRPLTMRERSALTARLGRQREMKWTAVRKLLGLHSGERFNLEEVDDDRILGNRTAAALFGVLKEQWDALSPDRQEALTVELNTIEDELPLLRRIQEGWGFTAEEAHDLGKLRFEPGYGRFSHKVLRKILPHLEAGQQYDKAAAAAGYDHSLAERHTIRTHLPPPPRVRNPIVQKALFEVRRVINALIRTYGRPDIIRVELAREAKQSRKERERLLKQNLDNKRLNDEAVLAAEGQGIRSPARIDLLKYRLWRESKMLCPYTGRSISLATLWSPEVEVEHIIPYSRSVDDSYMNLTLCMSSENRLKGNRTPFEAYGGDPVRYEEILQRIQPRKDGQALPWPKRRRFEQREVAAMDDFVARQLNDTRYICVEVKKYLEQICHRTEIGRGDLTASFRHLLGLNRLLNADNTFEKNRTDHRHHAIDATVIALIDAKLVRRLPSRYRLRENFPAPWPGFAEDLWQRLSTILVSHSTNRKISGALHEDTAYGLLPTENVFVYRKRLDPSFKAAWVDQIKDAAIQEAVRIHLARHGDDPKRAFADGVTVLHRDGLTPIRRVRLKTTLTAKAMLSVSDRHGTKFKHYKTANNHHVELFESADGRRRTGVVVSTLEAARRARLWNGRTVSIKCADATRLVMVLHPNDMVHHSTKGFYRVQKLDGLAITLRHHLAATLNENSERLIVGLGEPSRTLAPVSIDALGRILGSQ